MRRGYGNAARYAAQAQAAARAASQVQTASAQAAASEEISLVTGGASETVHDLLDEINTIKTRLTNAAIP